MTQNELAGVKGSTFEVRRVCRQELPASYGLAQDTDRAHVGKLAQQAGMMFLRSCDPHAVIRDMCGSVAQSEDDAWADVDCNAAKERSHHGCSGIEGFKDEGKGRSLAPGSRQQIRMHERRARPFCHKRLLKKNEKGAHEERPRCS